MGEKLVTPVIIFTVSFSSALASVSGGQKKIIVGRTSGCMSVSTLLSVALWVNFDQRPHLLRF